MARNLPPHRLSQLYKKKLLFSDSVKLNEILIIIICSKVYLYILLPIIPV